MPYIEGLTLGEFMDVIESPAPPAEGVQGLHINLEGKFHAIERVGRYGAFPVVTVEISGRLADVTVMDSDIRLFWFDDRTDSDIRQALSDVEFGGVSK
tara:strand:- start:640 stop:933 length:294 start_codon:yes stop_codon:yes gene_type:complete